MLDMLAQMGATFAGGVGKGVGDAISGAGGGGPMVSGGGTNDARSFMDGSGWTVATGRSTAKGGKVGAKSQDGQPADPPPGYGSGATQAGVSPMAVGILLALGAGAWLIARRRKG